MIFFDLQLNRYQKLLGGTVALFLVVCIVAVLRSIDETGMASIWPFLKEWLSFIGLVKLYDDLRRIVYKSMIKKRTIEDQMKYRILMELEAEDTNTTDLGKALKHLILKPESGVTIKGQKVDVIEVRRVLMMAPVEKKHA